jgi:hypothetical protein
LPSLFLSINGAWHAISLLGAPRIIDWASIYARLIKTLVFQNFFCDNVIGSSVYNFWLRAVVDQYNAARRDIFASLQSTVALVLCPVTYLYMYSAVTTAQEGQADKAQVRFESVGFDRLDCGLQFPPHGSKIRGNRTIIYCLIIIFGQKQNICVLPPFQNK